MRHEWTERETFRLERWRSIAAGITETANTTFIALVAIQFFHAAQETKGILLTNTSLGLLLSPLVLWWAARRKFSAGGGIALFSLLAAAGCALAAVPYFSAVGATHIWAFALGTLLAYVCAAGAAPMYLAIYEGNYRESNRGKLFGKNYFWRILANILFAKAAGELLEWRLDLFPLVFLVYAGCFAFSAWCVHRMPKVRLSTAAASHPLRSLQHVKEDTRFRMMLVSWMLLGFANLSMFPLRTEYLASPRYLALSASEVALYTAIVPNLARLCVNPIMGPLFDRMNFFNLRILLNMGFMLGFLSFFVGTDRQNPWGLWLGAILFGIANAGADVVWNLWVTKIAPAGKTSEYMAVHSFLTGIRGVIAPVFAFSLTKHVSIAWLACGCAGLVILASALLWRERSLAEKIARTVAPEGL